MPIYEYVCADCGAGFEELVRGDEQPACPACASTKVERKLSVFAARGDGLHADSAPGLDKPPRASGGGGCGHGHGGCAHH